MNFATRRAILFASLVVALAFGAIEAKQNYDQSRQQLQMVAKETAACREMAASIQQLRGGSAPVDADLPDEQLYAYFHDSARSAGVDDGQVIRSISPQPTRSVRGSSLQQKDVDLELQGMTMEQLMRFLLHLHETHARLQVSALTLREPKGFGVATVWNVEPLVLSYQIRESSHSNNANTSNP